MARRGPKTKYTEELIAKLDEYMAGYKDLGQPVPTVEGLAVYLKVHRDTLYAWAKEPEKDKISDTLAEIQQVQKLELLSGGLTGELNAVITKLVLSCNHDMHERSDQHMSGSLGLADLTDEELMRRASALAGESPKP